MELTKEYFDKALNKVATKNDLKEFATEKELKAVKDFIYKHVPTKEEIKQEFDKLRSELPSKEMIARLAESIDALAKQSKDNGQELKAMQHQLDTMKDWIKQASQKIGIEYKA